MIKKFYRRSQAFHSFYGHSFFSICGVFVLFCFVLFFVVVVFSKNNKTKTQSESLLSIFCQKNGI